MNAAYIVICLYFVLEAFVSLVLLLKGRNVLSRYMYSRRLISPQISELIANPLDTGITIAVYGNGRLGDIEYLLGLNYSTFEVIIMCDLKSDIQAYYYLKRYSMIATQNETTREVEACIPRGVYRSISRRYSKLIIVDKSNYKNYEAYNIALELANFDKIIFLDRSVTLEPNSLAWLHIALSQQREESVYAVIALTKESLPDNELARINFLRHFIQTEVGYNSLSRCATSEPIIALFDRECLVNAGSFSKRINTPHRMLLHIQQSHPIIKHTKRPRCLFIPELAASQIKNTSTGRAIPSHFTLIKMLNILALIAIVLIIISDIAAIISIPWGMIIGVAAFMYSWSLLEAVIAISAKTEFKVDSGRKTSQMRLFWFSPIYPFYRFLHISPSKNFRGN